MWIEEGKNSGILLESKNRGREKLCTIFSVPIQFEKALPCFLYFLFSKFTFPIGDRPKHNNSLRRNPSSFLGTTVPLFHALPFSLSSLGPLLSLCVYRELGFFSLSVQFSVHVLYLMICLWRLLVILYYIWVLIHMTCLLLVWCS